MMKELEKLTLIELPDNLSTMHIPLPEIKPSGVQVLSVDNLSGGYTPTEPIFSGINFAVERGEKLAIVAANGVGKTTLLNTIAGILPAFTGKLSSGYNVQHAVFYQEQAQVLDLKATIWQEVGKTSTKLTDGAIRAMLGNFLFSGDDINKKISVLSGGEKSRVGMIKVLVQQANFLLLDEPTNHLDIPSKEILLKTLKNFAGTIVFVSHDHDFINQLATSIIELSPTKAVRYPGNYDDYKNQKAVATGSFSEPSTQAQAVTKVLPVSPDEQKNIKKMEKMIDKLTQERLRLSAELEKYVYGTPEFSQRYDRLRQIEKEEPDLLNQWSKLQK